MREVNLRRARLAPLLAAQAATAAPSAGTLAIANCKAYALKEPVSAREYAILRIETVGGIAGWGETRSITAADLTRAATILRGRQATEFAPLHARLADLPNLQAAVNMALLDIVGQATKAPVYQVLGGPTRYKARALAPLAGADDAALLAALKGAQAAGFRAFLIPAAAPATRNSGQAFIQANLFPQIERRFVKTSPSVASVIRNASAFASCLGLCPEKQISGGKVLYVRTRAVKNRVALALRLGAHSLHADNSLGEFFRRMKRRLGPAQAITATAHKLARVVFHLLKYREPYNDTVFQKHDVDTQQRAESRLRRQAAQLGFQLVPAVTEQP